MSLPRILIISTSPETKGGISAVVKTHVNGELRESYRIKWLYSHIDRGFIRKLFYFLSSWIKSFYLIPSSDLIHIHLSNPPSLIRKGFYFYLARIFRKKIIVHYHAAPEVIFNSGFKFYYKHIFSRADCLLVLSEHAGKQFREKLKLTNRIEILYNPVVIRPNSLKVDKKKYILFAGTITKLKGYEDLLHAFARIAHSYPFWKLIFAGEGEIQKGQELAKRLGVEPQVDFCGWLEKEKKAVVFSEASIFCLPSYTEGFPMAVLDAWAFSLPVVSTPVGALPDIMTHGTHGLLYPIGDIESLSSCLEILMNDKTLRDSIASASSWLAINLFSDEKIQKDLHNLYRSILDKSNF